MKLVEVIADEELTETVSDIAKRNAALDFRLAHRLEDGRQAMRILLQDENVQATLDGLQTVISSQPNARLIVFPVEAALPLPGKSATPKKSATATSREALYDSVSKNAVLDSNFIVLVILSTLVAAIGLIKDNVAVVIGAMVIAPLLGPNLALALGTALGDLQLIRKSIVTNLAGYGIKRGAVNYSRRALAIFHSQPGTDVTYRRRSRFSGAGAGFRRSCSTVIKHRSVQCAGGGDGGRCTVAACSHLRPDAGTRGVTTGAGRADIAHSQRGVR